MGFGHRPVMLREVLDILDPKNGDVILDGTFGAGGYASALLARNENCRVLGIDRDETVLKFAEMLKDIYGDRFVFHNIRFSEIGGILAEETLDGLVLDLGVSSMQLEERERGFSFRKEAKLLMTMGKNKISAHNVVNEFSQEKLASIILNYGEELKSGAIAKKIFEYRKLKTIETTVELANIVRSCFKWRGKIDNATKTFQAIRIFVNDELEELNAILKDSIDLLKKDGRLIVVSFNSLEDRIVKKFFLENGGTRNKKINKYSKNIDSDSSPASTFSIAVRKPLVPSEDEIKDNARARSAKLRWGVRC
ncbi:MAG: 16S rRNA (cytosine(1402)-N(4))-methyltransferase RsmH [Rickettsiales bacterium]|jgi:16S rRNA (cytosine1402-N4)-methyltransferase|nr:16S rRNA (cytosine(1402)-N(4))-methyltransferase RsmH [Rickettsiales bacterium]